MAGLINGLLFTFLVPPWQHYDEPTHFEFSWLIANRSELPKPGDYDQNMRREVAASMIEHGFFKEMGGQPDLLPQSEPIWIGIPQVGDRPLYYLLASLPLFLLRFSDITFQLYAARLVSLALYLLAIAAAAGLSRDLFAPGNGLRWLAPLTLALLPGFTDLMTSVNNDVGAVAFFTLFLWSGVRLIRNGLSLRRVLALLGTVILCWLTKSTVLVALPLSIVFLLFAIFPAAKRRYAWATIGLLFVVALLATLDWGDAAGWARLSLQKPPTRVAATTPFGKSAFLLVKPENNDPAGILQPLSRAQERSLQGKEVTFGAWMWSDQEINAATPALVANGKSLSLPVQVTTTPAFYAVTATLDSQLTSLYVNIPAQGPAGTRLYLDGLVLVEGKYDPSTPPVFSSPSLVDGTWAGAPFKNLIQNASAEKSWLRLRPWFLRWAQVNYPSYSGLVIGVLLGNFPAGDYLYSTAAYLFYTFWGRFGWGHVRLAGFHPYQILLLLTVIGIAGLLLLAWRRRQRLPWATVSFFVATLVLIWVMAWLRGLNSLIGQDFIPSARYAYPVTYPTILVFLLGWVEILGRLGARFDRLDRVKYLVLAVFFLGLDILGLFSIYRFYYR